MPMLPTVAGVNKVVREDDNDEGWVRNVYQKVKFKNTIHSVLGMVGSTIYVFKKDKALEDGRFVEIFVRYLIAAVLIVVQILLLVVKNLFPTCGDDDLQAFISYMRETRVGYEKDQCFARGKNSITRAVELIESASPDESLHGVQLLYATISLGETKLKEERKKRKTELYSKLLKEIMGQYRLMKVLVVFPPSSAILQKLMQILNPREAHDAEMRNQAARILAYLALDTQLEQFPQGINHISSLICTFDEYMLVEPYHNDEDLIWVDYSKLVLRGLCILYKLASDKKNCAIIIATEGLLTKIMSPLTCDLIHELSGGAWSESLVHASLKIEKRPTVRTSCNMTLLKIIGAAKSEDWSISKLAREALAKSHLERESDIDVVHSLIEILGNAENKYRARAAIILVDMNFDHTVQEAMTSAMLMMLKERESSGCTHYRCTHEWVYKNHSQKEMLYYELNKDEAPQVLEKEGDDIEKQGKQCGGAQMSCGAHRDSKGNEGDLDVEGDEVENEEEEEVIAPALSFCVKVWETFKDQDWPCKFEGLPKKMQEMVKKNEVPNTHSLTVAKLICRMVILMMEHKCSYLKEEVDELIDTLPIASEGMANLDMSMVFGRNHSGTSLVSLVKDAKACVEKKSESEFVESSTSNTRQSG
uniref:Uncharacterized protein n=1 Tax=Aegilops tauschii TaxID=37682 RepID=M8CJZ8_AEGTA